MTKTRQIPFERGEVTSRRSFELGQAFPWVLLGLMVVLLTARAYWLAGHPIEFVWGDGPFQHLNSLRHWARSDVLGRDYNVFHGPLLALIHAPIFLWAGGDYWASEFSRQLVAPLVSIGGMLLLTRGLFGRWRDAAIVTALWALVCPLLGQRELIAPQNSQLAIRAALPGVALGLVGLSAPWAVISLVGGLAVAAGTDQGMALVATLGVLAVGLGGGARQILGRLVGLAALVPVAALAAYALVAGRYTPETLHFNFSQVMSDQFWFFGGPIYTESRFGYWRPRILLAVFAFAGAAALALVWRRPIPRLRRWMLIGLIVQGLIGSVAMFSTWAFHYLAPLVRALSLVAIVLLLDRRERLQRRVAWAVGFVGLVALPWTHQTPLDVRPWPRFQRVALPPMAHEALTGLLERTPPGAKVWSTYTGIYDAALGQLNPHRDYLIHALGPGTREEHVAKFVETAPDIVRTLRADVHWMRWLVNANWGFFDHLASHYEPVGPVGVQSLWRKIDPAPAARPTGPPPAAITGVAEGPCVILTTPVVPLPDGEPVVLAVTFEYKRSNLLARLPVLGPSARGVIRWHTARDNHFVTVPPWTERWTSPVLASPGERVAVCRSRELEWPWSGMDLISARATVVPMSSKVRKSLLLSPHEPPLK